MNPQLCDLCGATAPRTRQTPTLFGMRQLCARCRERYRTAVVGAIGDFHLRQRTSPLEFSQPREAA